MRDPCGNSLPGFSRECFQVVTGDSTANALRRAAVAPYQRNVISLRLEVERGTI